MKCIQSRLEGAKMIIVGAGGIFFNELLGSMYDEHQTTYELNQLPKSYITIGIGRALRNKHLINKGRKIRKSALIKNISYIKN